MVHQLVTEKRNVMYTHSGILTSRKKEVNAIIFNNTGKAKIITLSKINEVQEKKVACNLKYKIQKGSSYRNWE